jgi:2-amino-4-hydroxy-6-hydroxymethyldihydropteridine diphosphokinase
VSSSSAGKCADVTRAYISIGSNIAPEENIRSAISALRCRYAELELSPVYESKAVGFEGDDFFNLVAAFETDEGMQRIAAQLRELEDAHGRVRSGERFSARPLDLDLLLYGDTVVALPGLVLPRPEITEHAFVLLPLAQIAPRRRHPVIGLTYAELWERFDHSGQPLWPVDLHLQPAGHQR